MAFVLQGDKCLLKYKNYIFIRSPLFIYLHIENYYPTSKDPILLLPKFTKLYDILNFVNFSKKLKLELKTHRSVYNSREIYIAVLYY